MRPFNIEEAIAHPERLRHHTSEDARGCLVTAHGTKAVVSWRSASATATAVYDGAEQVRMLRLADPVVETWANVYPNGHIGSGLESREQADSLAASNRIACIRITIDGEEVTATVEPINGDAA